MLGEHRFFSVENICFVAESVYRKALLDWLVCGFLLILSIEPDVKADSIFLIKLIPFASHSIEVGDIWDSNSSKELLNRTSISGNLLLEMTEIQVTWMYHRSCGFCILHCKGC